MGEDDRPDPTRPLRADARRNRDRLIEVAKTMFRKGGADTSLEAIARAAGVGIGTLYRHFPTRDALITEVYRTETAQLVDAAATLAAMHPPVEALRAWMRLFVDYLATKHAVAEVFTAAGGCTAELYASSGTLLLAAFDRLVEAAMASGAIRLDMPPLDLLRALTGVLQASPGPDAPANARRMVDLLIAGAAAR